MREGDIVVVNRLVWLGRNTVHTTQLVEEFNRRAVCFRALGLGTREVKSVFQRGPIPAVLVQRALFTA